MMFKYDENIDTMDLRIRAKLETLAFSTRNESEMEELLKYNNPFINRQLALNRNLPLKIINTMLFNHEIVEPAYTMLTYIAQHPKLQGKHVEQLYKLAETENYKKSRFKEDIDQIFKLRKEQNNNNNDLTLSEKRFLSIYIYNIMSTPREKAVYEAFLIILSTRHKNMNNINVDENTFKNIIIEEWITKCETNFDKLVEIINNKINILTKKKKEKITKIENKGNQSNENRI